MRRMLAYLGALFPATALTTLSDAAINQDFYDNDLTRSRRGDDAEDEQDDSGETDGGAAGDTEGNGVANAANPGGAAVEQGGADSVSREINGLLSELDRINELAEFDIPMPGAVYSATEADGMYAPAMVNGHAGGGRQKSSVATDTDGDVETDTPAEGSDTGSEPDSGPTDEPTGTENTYAEPGVEDDSSMLVLLGGTAVGTGDATTDGHTNLEIIDYGAVTVAYGVATYQATADWDGSGEPPADATTFVDVYGADLVFVYHLDNEYSSQPGGGLQYTDTSTTYVVAIDFEDGHPLANEFDASDDNGFEPEFDPGLALTGYGPVDGYFDNPLLGGLAFSDFSLVHSTANGHVDIDDSGADLTFTSTGLDDSGNPVILAANVDTIEDISSLADLAAQTSHGQLTMSVSAYGPDTYASIDGEMFAVEDDFSGITGLAIGIA